MKSLYISSLSGKTNSLTISIGIMQLLKHSFRKVAFFKPIVENIDDENCDFMLKHFKLKQSRETTYGITHDEAQQMLATNENHNLYENLIDKYQKLQKEYDFVLVECDSTLNINLRLAKHFNTPVLNVIDANEKNINQVFEAIEIEYSAINTQGCIHFATFVNRTEKSDIKQLKNLNYSSDYLTFFIPKIDDLEKLTMSDINDTLNCELVFGSQKNLNQKISDIKIASMTLEHYLQRISKENIIIVSGDRSDIILGTLSAINSKNMPHIAGIILTGGIVPNDTILKLLDGFGDIGICILSVQTDTFKTSVDVSNIKPKITYQNYTKIALILGTFAQSVDTLLLGKSLNIIKSNIMTPIMFEFSIFEKAKLSKKHIVLNESSDDRILRACEILLYRGIVDITLIGNSDDILYQCGILGINLSQVKIINPQTSELTDIFAKEFFNLRKAKGVTIENAKDIMLTNDTYFATMMVHLGYADGMVSGAIGTTANTVRPALQIIKTKPNIDVVSSVFFMCFETKVLVYGDCAINPSPNAKELAQIAISSAKTARQFGIEPKVAMLSYSTGVSGSGVDVELVVDATKEVVSLDDTLIVEGPIQYDTAIDKQTALKKSPDGKLKGDATVLIFPDLNTGNNTYKAVQRSSGAVAIGPILQGLNKPINDLSRGCKVVDIVNTVAMTAIQAF